MAEMIGIPIATSVPNVKARMIIAATRPIITLLSVLGSESSEPIGPPTATCIPAAFPGAAASTTDFAISSVRSAEPTLSRTEMNAVFLSLLI